MHNQKLRKAREQKHWTIEKAADKGGVSWLTYSRWENRKQEPHRTTLDMLCQAFEMSSEDLGFASSNEQPQRGEVRDGLQLVASLLDQSTRITLTDQMVDVLSYL